MEMHAEGKWKSLQATEKKSQKEEHFRGEVLEKMQLFDHKNKK